MTEPKSNDSFNTPPPNDETTKRIDVSPPDPTDPADVLEPFDADEIMETSDIFPKDKQEEAPIRAASKLEEVSKTARRKRLDQNAPMGKRLSDIIKHTPEKERRHILENYEEGVSQGALQSVPLKDEAGKYIKFKTSYRSADRKARRTITDEYLLITPEQEKWVRQQRNASRADWMLQTGEVWAFLHEVEAGEVNLIKLATLRRDVASRDVQKLPKRPQEVMK